MIDLTAGADRVQLAKLAAPSMGSYLSGYYYQPINGSGGLSTSSTHGIGVLRVGKARISQRVKIVRLGAEVTAAGDAGSTVRLAVFADSASTPGYPDALLFDSGVSGSASTVLNNGLIAGDNVSVQEVTCSLTLDPGTYYFGAVVQNVTTTQPTLRTVLGPLPLSDPLPVATAMPTGVQVPTLGYTHLSVTGAIPAAFTTTKNLSSALARVFFKVA